MGSVRFARRPAPVAALAVAVAVALGCAGAGSDAAAAGPTFTAVRSVALVRRPDHGDRRAKDPLDAVSDSLASKGIAVRVIDVSGRDAPKDVVRLFETAEARASSGVPGAPPGRAAVTLGGEAGRAVRALGVDAVVTYHRLDTPLARAFGGTLPTPGAGMGGTYGRPTAPYRPLGALEVVGTDGQALLLDWGPRDQAGAGGAETPAEAVDAAVRALLGEPAEPDGA